MSANPSLPEQVLSVVSGVLEGVEPPGSLEAVLERLSTSHQRFLGRMVGNPEADPDRVQAAIRAFVECETGLSSLLESPDDEAAARAVVEGAQRLKDEERAYVRLLVRMGPSPFPDPNRVLLHLRCLREGYTDVRFARQAIEDMAGLQQRTREDLDEREERCPFRATREQALEAAGRLDTLGTQAEQLLSGWSQLDVPTRRQLLTDLDEALRLELGRLVDAMTRYVAAEAAAGPTANRAVNNVLRAVQKLDAEDMVEYLLQVEESLPFSSPLRVPIIRLRGSVAESDEVEVQVNLRQLVQAAGAATTGADADDEVAFDFMVTSDGVHRSTPVRTALPTNFQAAVDAVEAYLEQPGWGAERAQAVVEDLAVRLQSTWDVTQRSSRSGHEQEAAERGLLLLEEGIESLRVAIRSESWAALEAARDAMGGAADALSSLAWRRSR